MFSTFLGVSLATEVVALYYKGSWTCGVDPGLVGVDELFLAISKHGGTYDFILSCLDIVKIKYININVYICIFVSNELLRPTEAN